MTVFEGKVRVYTIQNNKKYYAITVPQELAQYYAGKDCIIYESGASIIIVPKENIEALKNGS